jgi:tRNA G18 (ribose-2'-O)-methylase SpoU
MVEIMSMPLTETFCPYPECNERFSADLPAGRTKTTCPKCHKAITARLAAVFSTLEREQEKRKRMGLANCDNEAKAGPGYEETFVAVVEDVRSLFNVGAVFRTADGAGMDKVYLCGITGAPPRKEIEKVSLGAENTVNWEWGFGCVPILRRLKERGFQIVALEKTETSRPLTELLAEGKIARPLCLVVGNEVSGVSAEALSLSDIVAELPMRGMKESLNVSVAFGIAVYAISEVV